MQEEGYGNPKDGFRSGFRNGGGGGGGEKSDLPPPHPRRKEILMEAGRLAAEYLVSKGLLPRESLSPKWGPNRKFREFRGRARDSSPVDRRRTSDGGSGRRRYCCRTSDGGNGRRRHCDGDEYSRNRFQGWKRNDGSYNNREYSLDGGRDSVRWRGRDRSNDRIEDEDDYARDYRRDQRVRFNRRPLRSVFVGESGSEDPDNAEDRRPRRRSSSTWKEPPMESDVYLSKAGDGGRMVRSETGDELKCDTSGDLNKRNVVEEESDIVQTCVVEGDGKCDGDLTKLCGFSEEPTRPLSSVLQTNQKDDQEIVMEASNTAKVASDVMKIAAGVEKRKEGSSSDSPANQSDTLKTQVNDSSSIIPTQSGEESVNKGQERSQTPAVVTEEEEASQREGVKRQREPSPEDKYYRQDNLRARQSSPEEERLQMDVEKVTPVAAEQEKPVEDTCFPEVDPVLDVKLEEEKPLLPISYKICDLNLMCTPDIIEIPDDPVLDHVHLPAPGPPVTGKEISMDRGLSIGVHNNGTDDCSQLPNDDKVVQVIDLENGSHMEADCCDTSRPKDGTMTYPNLDNFLSRAEHEDLPVIQDGYFLALSEFLGTEISRCPSVPSYLKNSAGRNGPS